MLSALPLKGLSNDEAEALRVCMAVQPARATGIWWAVHDRATARALLARAGIVGAECGWGDGGRRGERVQKQIWSWSFPHHQKRYELIGGAAQFAATRAKHQRERQHGMQLSTNCSLRVSKQHQSRLL